MYNVFVFLSDSELLSQPLFSFESELMAMTFSQSAFLAKNCYKVQIYFNKKLISNYV